MVRNVCCFIVCAGLLYASQVGHSYAGRSVQSGGACLVQGAAIDCGAGNLCPPSAPFEYYTPESGGISGVQSLACVHTNGCEGSVLQTGYFEEVDTCN